MSAVRHLEIAEAEADQRFDRWARKRFPALAHGEIQKLLRTGQFRLDGKRAQASDHVRAGQTVRVPPAAEDARHTERRVGERDAAFIRRLVIHEDDELIVLNKPAGLAVQGGSKTTRHIDGMLDAFGAGEARPRLVHRLDRDTSGVLVLARSAAVARTLMHAFQQHEVDKLYWAIVLGRPERTSGLIDQAIGKEGPAGRERMSPRAGNAKKARTDFRVIARAGRAAAWVGLRPLTGRTHQLRAHMAAIGTPILGDGKYRGESEAPPSAPQGLMLHAREIALPRRKGPPLQITAEPPPHFREALAWLGLRPDPLPFSRLADWD